MLRFTESLLLHHYAYFFFNLIPEKEGAKTMKVRSNLFGIKMRMGDEETYNSLRIWFLLKKKKLNTRNTNCNVGHYNSVKIKIFVQKGRFVLLAFVKMRRSNSYIYVYTFAVNHILSCVWQIFLKCHQFFSDYPDRIEIYCIHMRCMYMLNRENIQINVWGCKSA